MEPLYNISYHFGTDCFANSELFEDPTEFVREVRFTVNRIDDAGRVLEEVGKGKFSHILFSLAMDADFPVEWVMDATQSILNMSEVLFILDEDSGFFDKIDEYFEGDPPMNMNVCFLERLELLPIHRGKGLTRMILNELARSYYDCCGLWVLKAYPLQHNEAASDNQEVAIWREQMGYADMEADFEKAQYKLFHLYQQMGMVNPFDMSYFIAKPEKLAFIGGKDKEAIK